MGAYYTRANTVIHNLMGTDCSTPITRFSLPILKKNMKKCVFRLPCIRCEIALGQKETWIMQEMAPHSLGGTTLLHKSVLPITMIFSMISFLEKIYK